MIHNWRVNFESAISEHPNFQIIETVFSSLLDFTLADDWCGACHGICAISHVLLNESEVENVWRMGEIKVGNGYSDHSWIEINGQVFDIAICRPLHEHYQSAPVINGIDIKTNQPTATQYGVHSGKPDDRETEMVKQFTLSQYLSGFPDGRGWRLIDIISDDYLEMPLDIESLIEKYDQPVTEYVIS